jgi:uracil-DNA glycosylase
VYELPGPKAWILWGSYAQSLFDKVSKQGQQIGYLAPHPALILKTAHPSPLSAHKGFFGSKPFSKINEFLEKNGLSPIYWDMPF